MKGSLWQVSDNQSRAMSSTCRSIRLIVSKARSALENNIWPLCCPLASIASDPLNIGAKAFFLPFLCLCVCLSAPTSVCFCLQALHSTRVRRDYAGRYLSAYQTAGHKSRPRRRVGLTVAEITGLSEYFDHGYVQQEARDGPLFFFFLLLSYIWVFKFYLRLVQRDRERKEKEREKMRRDLFG